jgi:hypothetical protein
MCKIINLTSRCTLTPTRAIIDQIHCHPQSHGPRVPSLRSVAGKRQRYVLNIIDESGIWL